jgi:endogenous inhibitor of DNA gyrase (YacG/DUF329 family)
MIYTCERCGEAFERLKKRGGYFFCSQKCANQHAIKLTRELIEPFALQGSTITFTKTQLKVDKATVRRALLQFGLFRTWSQQRYKKCAVAV